MIKPELNNCFCFFFFLPSEREYLFLCWACRVGAKQLDPAMSLAKLGSAVILIKIFLQFQMNKANFCPVAHSPVSQMLTPGYDLFGLTSN